MHMDDDTFQVVAVIGICLFVVLIIIYCVSPSKGSMQIETVNWQWEVKVYQYVSVPQEIDSRKYSYKYDNRSSAEADMDRVKNSVIPAEAYDITVTVKKDTDRIKIGEIDGDPVYTYDDYYYYIFSYRVNSWDYFSSVYASGTDDQPYEPKRPYKEANEIPDWTVGMFSCGLNHDEKYTVTGTSDGKSKTFDISKEDWQRIHNTGVKEIWYKKGKFDDHIDKVAFEKGDL